MAGNDRVRDGCLAKAIVRTSLWLVLGGWIVAEHQWMWAQGSGNSRAEIIAPKNDADRKKTVAPPRLTPMASPAPDNPRGGFGGSGSGFGGSGFGGSGFGGSGFGGSGFGGSFGFSGISGFSGRHSFEFK